MTGTASRAAELLRKEIRGVVALDVPMAPHTSFNIGGPADLWIEPEELRALTAAIRVVYRHEMPLTVIGLGSNSLVSDRGIRGAVICLKRSFRDVSVTGERVTAGAGVTMPLLSQQVSRLGLTGYEWACGIPGSVGGGLVMNAGAHGGDMARSLLAVQVVDSDGSEGWLEAKELHFSYRSSALRNGNQIVTAGRFEFETGDLAEIRERLRDYRERRRAAQPETSQCAGSIFKNPEGGSAGRLLQSLGAKGMRVGGAEVSMKHANFIVNTGTARATDVRALIVRLQEMAHDRAGIDLETEVLMAGDWPHEPGRESGE